MREQQAERQRAADEQHVGERHLLHGHDDAEVIGGAGDPVEQERMHKVDEHGVGREDADGLVEQGGGGAPLSRLTATAPLKGSHISNAATAPLKGSHISNAATAPLKGSHISGVATAPLKGSHISSIAKRSYISGVVSFAFKPVEGETEEQNRADGIDEALRTELMIGVSEVQQAVALALHCVVAAVHVPANRGEVQHNDTCRILMQECEKFLPIHRRQTAADKDEQIM